MIQVEPPSEGTTFGQVLAQRASEEPDLVYCRAGGRAYTLAEIDRGANRIANGLLALGLARGDRVGVMLANSPDCIMTIFGLMRAGLVRVPVNIHARGPSLESGFRSFAMDALIAGTEFAAQLDELPAGALPRTVIWRGGARHGQLDYDAVFAASGDSPAQVLTDPDQVLLLTSSSGTTGAPKGIVKTDRNLRAGPMTILRLTECRKGDVLLLWEPLYHSSGVGILVAAVIRGMTLVLLERFSASQFWDQVRAEGATHIHYLGGVLQMLLKQPPSAKDRTHGARIAWGGGCPVEIWRQFEDRFGVTIREGYGLSELTSFVTLNVDDKLGSIGKPISYFDVALVDDAGNAVADGAVGEMCVRARVPGLAFPGYFRNEAATRSAMRASPDSKDGWFRTGDLARRDADGDLFFAGRCKDMVRRRGINISAWEVEKIVNEHDDVRESALIGVPSELGDEELKLFVQPVPGRTLDPLALVQWCEARLPYYQIPRYIEFVDEFPKTATQRTRKGELSKAVAGVWDLEASGYRPRR